MQSVPEAVLWHLLWPAGCHCFFCLSRDSWRKCRSLWCSCNGLTDWLPHLPTITLWMYVWSVRRYSRRRYTSADRQTSSTSSLCRTVPASLPSRKEGPGKGSSQSFHHNSKNWHEWLFKDHFISSTLPPLNDLNGHLKACIVCRRRRGRHTLQRLLFLYFACQKWKAAASRQCVC